MSDKELKSTFADYDIKTIKAMYQDKATIDIFSIGISNRLTQGRDWQKKYSAINAIFTSVQKFISIMELVQQIFKVSADSNPAK